MGLGNNAGRTTFINVKKGKLVIKKEGVIEEFGHLVGSLVGMEIKEDEYEGKKYKKLSMDIRDADDRFVLEIRVGSGYWIGFCMAIPNINTMEPIMFIPNMKTEGTKDKMTMFLSQNDGNGFKAVKWFWTKDNPGNLPRLIKVMVRGNEEWDNTAQNEFLIEYLMHKIKPSLVHPALAGGSAAGAPAAAGSGSRSGPTNADNVTEPIDDLPF